MNWMTFKTRPKGKILVVSRDPEKSRLEWDFKLVHWDGEFLTEECGKIYTWTHNPYLHWTGIA